MSATAELAPRTRVCVDCGVEFADFGRTSPRSRCDECREAKANPRPAGGLRLVDVPSAFSVPHFREWSARLQMKDGDRFVLEDWQALFLEDVFARDESGRPVFDTLWLIVPEGNGKTTFTSLLVLYVIEHTAEAWCPVAASARDQAVGLTYRIASGFVERNRLPHLLHPGYREIRFPGTGGAVKIFASDAASGDGVDPVGVLVIEELHRLANLDLYETWSGKLDKSDAQLIVVSTAGEPGSSFEDMREKLHRQADDVRVERDGCFRRSVSPATVIHDYSVPVGADPEDVRLVALANPFSRKTEEALRRKRSKPSWKLAHWRRFTCNLPTRPVSSAITEAEWDAWETDEGPAEGEPCDVGLDVGWKWDTTALAPFWVPDPHRRVLFDPVILVPPRDGTALSQHRIEDAFLRIHERNPVQTVAMDIHNAEALAEWLEENLGCEVVDRIQSNQFAAIDYASFTEALRNGWLWHTPDAEAREHVLNATLKVLGNGSPRFQRPSEVRAAVELQGRRVIDYLTAASIVHSTIMREEAALDVELVEVL